MFDVVNVFFCIKFRLCKCFAGEIILKKYNIEKNDACMTPTRHFKERFEDFLIFFLRTCTNSQAITAASFIV